MQNKDLEYYMGLKWEIKTVKISDSYGGGYASFISILGKFLNGYGPTVFESISDLGVLMKGIFETYIEDNVDIPEPEEYDVEAEFNEWLSVPIKDGKI